MNGHLGKLREFSSRGEQLGATWTRASSREGWGYFMSHHSRVTIACDLLASTRVIHQQKTFFVARARPRARFIAPRARSSASASSRARANAGVEARGRS